MKNEFEYIIKGKRLIVTKCPKTLTKEKIREIQGYENIEEDFEVIELCEGIEVITENTFDSFYNLKKIKLTSTLKKIEARVIPFETSVIIIKTLCHNR